MSDTEDFFYRMDGDGKIVKYCAKTGNEISSPSSLPKKSPWVFNEQIADVICQKIADGWTLSKLTKKEGFPTMGVITRWRSENEGFDHSLQLAQEARAMRLHDRMLDSLDDTRDLDKDQIAAEKLYFDKLKYLAKADDRKRYGERDSKDSGGSGSVTINLNTGINREERVVPNEVLEVIGNKKKEQDED